MKIVIADNVGGFWLTEMAYEYLGLDWQEQVIYPLERAAPGYTKENYAHGFYGIDDRSNEKLVKMVEVLGENAGNHLVVIDVDDKREWRIFTDDTGWEAIRYLDELPKDIGGG